MNVCMYITDAHMYVYLSTEAHHDDRFYHHLHPPDIVHSAQLTRCGLYTQYLI